MSLDEDYLSRELEGFIYCRNSHLSQAHDVYSPIQHTAIPEPGKELAFLDTYIASPHNERVVEDDGKPASGTKRASPGPVSYHLIALVDVHTRRRIWNLEANLKSKERDGMEIDLES